MVGVSDRPPLAPRARAASSAVPATSSWATPQAFAALVAVDDRPAPSLGHNPPAWSGTVHVSPGLESPYVTLGASPEPWPTGAILAERHANADGSPAPTYVMRKLAPGSHPDGGDWAYAVVASDGTLQNVGDVSFCARCHAEAPHQFLFGPRAEARRRLHGEPPQGTDPSRGAPPSDEGLSPPEDTPPPTKTAPTPARPPKR